MDLHVLWQCPIQNIHKGFPFIYIWNTKSLLLSLFAFSFASDQLFYSKNIKWKTTKNRNEKIKSASTSNEFPYTTATTLWCGDWVEVQLNKSWKIQVSSNKVLLQLLHSTNKALKFVELYLPCTPSSWGILSLLLLGIMCVLCAWHGDSRHGRKKKQHTKIESSSSSSSRSSKNYPDTEYYITQWVQNYYLEEKKVMSMPCSIGYTHRERVRKRDSEWAVRQYYKWYLNTRHQVMKFVERTL